MDNVIFSKKHGKEGEMIQRASYGLLWQSPLSSVVPTVVPTATW